MMSQVDSTNRSISNNCKILTLATEILESIFDYLDPNSENDIIRCRENYFFIPDGNDYRETHKNRAEWRQTCKSIRLTCKKFSQLNAPCLALFGDLKVTIWPNCFAKLQWLSSHEQLKTIVRRLIFIWPEVSVDYRGPEAFDTYKSTLISDLLDHCRIQAERLGIDTFENPIPMEAVMEQFVIEDRFDSLVREAHSAYGQAIQAQESVFDTSFFETVAKCISQFSNIRTIFISGRDTRSVLFQNLYEDPDLEFDTFSTTDNVYNWCRKRCPDSIHPYGNWQPLHNKERFASSIIDMLATCRISPIELAFNRNQEISTLQISKQMLGQLHNLQVLDLTMTGFPGADDFAPGERWEDEFSWKTTVEPLLKAVGPQLKKLSIRFGSIKIKPVNGPQAKLFQMSFPKLEAFYCGSTTSMVGHTMVIAPFIQQNPSLCSIRVNRISFPRAEFRRMFQAIRVHPHLIDYFFNDCELAEEDWDTHIPDPDDHGPPFFICSLAELGQRDGLFCMPWYDALARYIENKGTWNAELTEKFGDI